MRNRHYLWTICAGLAAITILAGCASVSNPSGSRWSVIDGNGARSPERNIVQVGSTSVASTAATSRPRRSRASVEGGKRQLVVEGALSLVGSEELSVNGQTFPNDCTGVVRAAYWYAGIDLAQDFANYTGNGVTRIYSTLESDNLLYNTDLPEPGDIVFWDNTYDRNEDGKWNDELTHVGVVVSAEENGQIEYVHCNYRTGIVAERMNLMEPDTVTRKVGGKTVRVNSAMRMKGQVVNDKWLASHLVRGFGKGYLLD